MYVIPLYKWISPSTHNQIRFLLRIKGVVKTGLIIWLTKIEILHNSQGGLAYSSSKINSTQHKI